MYNHFMQQKVQHNMIQIQYDNFIHLNKNTRTIWCEIKENNHCNYFTRKFSDNEPINHKQIYEQTSKVLC